MRKPTAIVAALVGIGVAWSAQAADKPIKVAVLDALSGAYAQYGQPTIYGARYVFDKVNAAGGLFGRKIELVSEDDGCAPKQAVGGATKLAADEDVVAVLGLTCSGAAIAVRDSVAASAPFPFITFSAGGYTSSSRELGGLNPNFFFVSTAIHMQAGSIVNFVMNQATKPARIAFVGQTDVYGKEGLQGVTDMLEKYGMKLVAAETVEPRAADLTPQILKLKEAKPDVLIGFIYEVPAQTLLRQANDLGFRPTIVTSGAIVNLALYNSLPPAALAHYFGTSVLRDAFSSPAMKPILDNVRTSQPHIDLNWLPLLAVGGAETLLEAMRRAGPGVTGPKVRDQLEKLTNFQTSTLAYPVSFSEGNHTAGRGMRVYRIADGTERSATSGYWPGLDKAFAAVTP